VQEIFLNEFKPCLKYSVAQDLYDLRNTLTGVIHSAFSLNSKVRELTSIGLENHHSTTTSHVRFVMKMAKALQKTDLKSKHEVEKPVVDPKVKASISALEKENADLKSTLKRLESRMDSFKAQIKNHLNITDDDFGKVKRSKLTQKSKAAASAAKDEK
jgi:uncharacterized protein YlxW (UPF0749 family)